jgi:3-phenylpropionate/trans-cinnamate dioxygenase ferredoxin subunit
MPEWVTVARTEDVPEGELLGAVVGDDQVLVANVGGSYRAVGEVCTHAGCLLSEGWVENGAVECMCHGSRFDLATGAVVEPPATEPLATYQVQIEGNEIQIARPGT